MKNIILRHPNIVFIKFTLTLFLALNLQGCGSADPGGSDLGSKNELPNTPTTPPPPVSTDMFPADRVINWKDTVGVEGGIPARTSNIRNCVTEHNVPTNGTTDATTQIQACLNATIVNGVAFLPAGNYVVTATIRIPANKTLRGAGRESTKITAEAPIDRILSIGAGTSSTPLLTINSGHTRDSQSMVLTNASTINSGDFVLINELNDNSIPVTPASNAPGEGNCNWCDQFGATRLRAQVMKVTSKTDNTIGFAPAKFFYNFSSGLQPRVMKLNNMNQYSGIENLTVKNGAGATSGWRVNVYIAGAANSWVKNVRVDTCGKRCIDLRTYFARIEIRDNYITRCIDKANSDTCYGTEVAEGSSSLIENNIYYETANGPLLMWGASGNVVSYNYVDNVYRLQQRDSWFWPNSWSHGAHTSYNLWEGNDLSAINWDGYWGSSSHNTAFRNRLWGNNPDQGLVAGHIEVAALLIENNNNYMSAVGNVLGKTGWSNSYQLLNALFWSENAIYSIGIRGVGKTFSTLFRNMNYDYVSNSLKRCGESGEPECQGGNATATLPSSLYLSQKPTWYGNSVWPPVNPVGPVVNDIPAKVLFNSIPVGSR